MTAATTPQATFDGIAAGYADRGDVAVGGRMMRATGMLKVSGRIAAMLVDGRLVVKLPAARVTALVDAGNGERFATKPGKPMKEWLAVPLGGGETAADWDALVADAVAFVSRAKS